VKRILVVEDEPTILAAVATRLRAEESLVETAIDGPSAVATAAATEPMRQCARYRDEDRDAWYEFNLSRARASHDGTPPSDGCAEYWDPEYSRG
jgi:CheY-like chemotaxis protein